MSMPSDPILPLARPILPSADRLLPYLRQIDANRHYSNAGPLATALENRLARQFALPDETVALAASGTAALTAALMELAPMGSLCLVPSYTFAATAQAILQAGLVPYFLDVRAEDWALDPVAVQAAADRLGAAAVVPVVPFGAPFDYALWDRVARQSRLAVVIDAAAAFDTARPAHAPVMISLHATKIFGVGEGGCVIWRDLERLARVRRRLNFGLASDRSADLPGLNGKISEYHAAVGLAALDEWPDRRQAWRHAAGRLADGLAALPGLSLQPGWGQHWVSSTLNVRLTDGTADLQDAAARRGIAVRPWWPSPCHRMPAFGHAAGDGRADLTFDCPVSDTLAREVIGLPFHCAMDEADCAKVIALCSELC